MFTHIIIISDKQEFIGEVTVLGRALTKTFIHIAYGRMLCTNKRLYVRSYENQFSTT